VSSLKTIHAAVQADQCTRLGEQFKVYQTIPYVILICSNDVFIYVQCVDIVVEKLHFWYQKHDEGDGL